LDCLRAAAGAGAETVAICDTNGSSLPPQVVEATAAVLAAVGDRVRVAIHCHNDAECGVANTLAAVEVGARQVQGTMNGVGERTGNANLVSIIANLQLKMGRRVLADEQLARLTEAAHFVDELLNRPPNRAQAYVGRDAFAHKGGLHVAGVRADSATFEHVEPGLVGNTRELLVSELAGRHTVAERAAAAGSSSTTPLPSASSTASSCSSTAAISSRPPTAPSTCSCAASQATTSRSSAWSPGA
jgi:2-isopropylmalate synthase